MTIERKLLVSPAFAVVMALMLLVPEPVQAVNCDKNPNHRDCAGGGGGGGGGGGKGGGKRGKGGTNTAWRDDFTGSTVNTDHWVIAEGSAPGYRPAIHRGFFQSDRVTLQDGYLVLRLSQGYGPVDSNDSGVISLGGAIYSKKKYGYGTYEWRMRMSSTAASPTATPGFPISGSVSAGFNYVNNSETEIDLEFGAHAPGVLYMVNWKNPDTSQDPLSEHSTFNTGSFGDDLHNTFKTYRFVWTQDSISFYVEDVNGDNLLATHLTNLPSASAHFFISHWGSNSPYWGGMATPGTDRYFYVDWASYTPPN